MEDSQLISIPEFENLSIEEISKQIEDFKLLVLNNDIPFDEIKSRIRQICYGYRKENYHWFRFKEGLYRARKHENEWEAKYFNKTADIWYRDWSKTDESNYKYGRLNRPGQNFMYLSVSRNASLIEVKPKEGDWVTVANVVPLNPNSKINLCLVAENYLRNAHPDLKNIIQEPNIGNRKLGRDSFDKIQLIDDFLIYIFTLRVEEECDYKYKPSVAVWEYLNEISMPLNNSGILYPSIAFNYNTVNVGLCPSAVDYQYGIDQLITFSIDSIKCDEDYTLINVSPLQIGFSSLVTSGNVKIEWRKPTSEEVRGYSTEIKYSLKS